MPVDGRIAYKKVRSELLKTKERPETKIAMSVEQLDCFGLELTL